MTDMERTDLRTAAGMIRIFCRGRHKTKTGLCADCAALLAYAAERLRRCPHHPKPACRACATHCYAPAMRARMREVMRYAGPRMFFRHPLLALQHYLNKTRPA